MSELHGLQTVINQIHDHNAEVLAIALATVEESRTSADSQGLTYPVLSDTDGKVVDAYGLRHPEASINGGDIARPAMFIVDPEGKIVWQKFTDNWRIRVRPETVLTQLRSLAAEK